MYQAASGRRQPLDFWAWARTFLSVRTEKNIAYQGYVQKHKWIDPAQGTEVHLICTYAYSFVHAHVTGNLFTYNREEFWKILHCLPEKVEEEIRERNRYLNEKETDVAVTASEAERLYHIQDGYWHWQDEFSEEDSLTVWRIVREAVDAAIVDGD